jgi:hypothetical protein
MWHRLSHTIALTLVHQRPNSLYWYYYVHKPYLALISPPTNFCCWLFLINTCHWLPFHKRINLIPLELKHSPPKNQLNSFRVAIEQIFQRKIDTHPSSLKLFQMGNMSRMGTLGAYIYSSKSLSIWMFSISNYGLYMRPHHHLGQGFQQGNEV